MKIERSQLRTALLAVALQEYAVVPGEEQIDYAFSQAFRERAYALNFKSQKKTWRYWNTYRRRIILVAVIVALIATLAACAPIIKKLYIEYFVVNNGISYGITFDPEQAANTPRICEEYHIPLWDMTGYSPEVQIAADTGVVYVWANDCGAYISYAQCIIPADATNSTWIGIDSEHAEQNTELIGEYAVNLFEDVDYLLAVWTDNSYIYNIEVANTAPDKLATVKAIMDSLVAVEPTKPVS